MSDLPSSPSTAWDRFLTRLVERQCPPEHQDDGSILAPCPSPTHGGDGIDSNPSLRAFVNDSGDVVLKCRAGCPTPSVLKALGLSYRDLYDTLLPDSSSSSPFLDADDLDLREAVYESLLAWLPLAPRHLKSLQKRGLTPDEIHYLGYKTLATEHVDRADTHLASLFDREDLARVPGFDESGHLSRSFCGILIPLRRPGSFKQDPQAPIYLLKVNRSSRPKYFVWASDHLPKEAGFHWPLPNLKLTPSSSSLRIPLRITEGEYKADIASLRTGILTLSMPGINAWPQGLDRLLVEVTDSLGTSPSPLDLRVAWDWADVVSKPALRQQYLAFLDALAARGYQAGIEIWDTHSSASASSCKGIDDALNSGLEIHYLPPQAARDRLVEMLSGSASFSSSSFKPGKKKLFSPPAPSFSETETPSLPAEVASSSSMPCPENAAPFPLDALPPEIQTWVTQASTLLNTPPDYVACAALTVAGRALGSLVRASILPGWEEQANLFMVIVAPPGSTKSPALAVALKPLTDLQGEFHEDYKRRMAAWRDVVVASKGPKAKLPPVPHEPHHLWVNDATVEAVVAKLELNSTSKERQDRAVLYFRDELSAWVNSLNQYRGGQGADREFYLTAWSGGVVKYDRKGSQDVRAGASTPVSTIYLHNPFLAVLGSTTNEVVSTLQAKGGLQDGFYQRILFSAPPPPPFFRLPEVPPAFPSRLLWSVVIRRLLCWSTPTILKASPGAYQIFRDFYSSQADLVDTGSVDADGRAMLSKHRAYVLRLALILHALSAALGHSTTAKLAPLGGEPSLRPLLSLGEIETKDAEGAVALIHYFQSHYEQARKYLLLGPEDRRIADFVSWVHASCNGRSSPRDLYGGTHFGCRGKSDALKLMKQAEDRGRGILITRGSDDEAVFYAKPLPPAVLDALAGGASTQS